MCAVCGFPAVPGHWTEAGDGGSPHERLRARHRRVAVLRAVLPAFGLAAHDSFATPGLVLSDQTGIQAMVADLSELWAAADALGRRVDPLDPRLIGSATGPREAA